METWKDFLLKKGVNSDEDFEKMDVEERLKLANDYNAELKKSFEEATKNNVSKEDLDAYKTAFTQAQENIIKMVESIGLAVKALAEKGGRNLEDLTKSELVEMLEKSAEEAGKDSRGKITEKKGALNATHLINELNKAALITTDNINTLSGWSPLFGNYIDNRIHRAPLLYSTIMDDIEVTTQEGTESIIWMQRINEDGDAEWLDEGEAKPLVDAEWDTVIEATKEVALMWKFTHRFLFHTRKAVQDFEAYARELMENKIPDTALLGDATANPKEINGVTTLASAWVVPPAIAASTFMPNVYDAVLALATAIRLRGYQGQIVVRLNDVYSYLMKSATKDLMGNYIVPPFTSQDGTQVSDVRIKFDSRLPMDKILGGVLWNYKLVIAEDIMFFEGYNEDDFSKNLISRKLEAFVGSYLPGVHRPSIIYADIDEILGDIEQGNPPSLPIIASLSPTSGAVASVVTITGTNLAGVTSVKFGTTNAPTFTVVSPTQVTVTVPTMSTGATFIEVSNVNGTSNAIAFTVV